MASDKQEAIAAAERRAAALARGDTAELRQPMHRHLRWTTHVGAVLDRDAYIAGNTDGSLVWREQRLEQPEVSVVGDTAILTAVVVDEVERDGERQTFRLRLTQTWVREAGAWQCIGGHAGPEGTFL
jgi:ketosteroid isomerase-like protein